MRLHEPDAEFWIVLVDPSEPCVIAVSEMVAYGLWKDFVEASERYLS
jgi:hypothetical protein